MKQLDLRIGKILDVDLFNKLYRIGDRISWTLNIGMHSFNTKMAFAINPLEVRNLLNTLYTV